MNRNIVLVSNPVSGKGDLTQEELVLLIDNNLQPRQLTLLETQGKDDITRVEQKIKDLQADTLLISGGDGTIKTIASAAFDASVDVGIIPSGSANGLAKCLGISTTADALEAIKNKKTILADVLWVGDELCLHMCDFGFNAGLVKKFEDEEGRGMLTYFKTSLQQLKEARLYRFDIEIENHKVSLDAQMVIVANGDRYGTGALINPAGRLDDGLMEVIIISPQNFNEALSMSFNLILGNVTDSEHVTIIRTNKVSISNPDGADFQIDGEVMSTPNKVIITCNPGKIRFFTLL